MALYQETVTSLCCFLSLLLIAFLYFLYTTFILYFPLQTTDLNSCETKYNNSGKIGVWQCITCWGVQVGRFLTFIYKGVDHF